MSAYLDWFATAPMAPEVRDAMMPWLGPPANPGSAHAAGRRAASALEDARDRVAAAVGARPEQVIFVSGVTEALMQGAMGLHRRLGEGDVASGLGHPALVSALAATGRAQRALGVSPVGLVDDEVPPGVVIVGAPWVQHETGALMPVAALVASAKERGAAVLLDATQAVGRVDVRLEGADALVFGSHKLGGPPGIGALVVAASRAFPPLFPGAQERGRRAGTTAVALAVGFGAACVRLDPAATRAQLGPLTALTEAIVRRQGGRLVVGDAPRAPGVVAAVFGALRGEDVVTALDLAGVCVSAGAACASGSQRPSEALKAMGDPNPAGLVRISLGASTTEAELAALEAALSSVLPRLRGA